jgi:lipoate-protein ligase A
MWLWDCTWPTPEENLACDEALLDVCEAGQQGPGLRLWEPTTPFVVLGYANHARREVNLEFCRHHGIPVLRRLSGGGTVLQGPGCLNYSLLLPIDENGPLTSIPGTNHYVLRRHQEVLSRLLERKVRIEGQTDLAIDGLKCSGNAQRRRKRFLLYHGSFLLKLDLALMERALPMPSKQPDYRSARSHLDFLVNLPLSSSELKRDLAEAWQARGRPVVLPQKQIGLLVEEKYGRTEWNLKF